MKYLEIPSDLFTKTRARLTDACSKEGFGIRLENDIVVKQSGNIDLMASNPIEPDEIEALMARKS